MDLSGVDTSSKAYWGPRLWILFHCLAEISDRRDMVMLWNKFMTLSAGTMPCEQCRVHLGTYMRTHTFVRFPKIHLVTGEMVKARAVSEVFNLHNEVNARLAKPIFTSADMVIYQKTRSENLAIIHKVYDELKTVWTPFIHSRIHPAIYGDWKKHVNLMIALASGGPD